MIAGVPYDAEIEYLESAGAQYIDTGIAGSSTLRIEMTGQKSDASWGVYFGAGISDNRIQAIYLNGYNRARIGNASVSLGLDTEKFNIVCDTLNKNVVYNGTTYPFAYTTSLTNLNICIFTRNEGGGTFFDKAFAKCWCFKIWDNNTLVRDFVPVRVGTTGYLYDRVSRKLFGNAGTGAFTIGPDVATPVMGLRRYPQIGGAA